MLRHIVLFRWREDADAAAVAAALEQVRGLPERIAGVRDFTLAEDAGVMDGNHDAVIVADFEDAEAFRAYQQDPAHVEVVTTHLKPLLVDRAAIQLSM